MKTPRLILFLGLLLLALGAGAHAQAQANVTAGTPLFLPADVTRTYMDVGAVWNGTSRVDNTGSPTGDIMRITYTNSGNATAFDFAPQLVLPAGFTRVGVINVTASSGAPVVSGSPATTGTVTVNLGGYDLPASATITLSYHLRTDTTIPAGTYALQHGRQWATVNAGALNALQQTQQNIIVRAGAYITTVSPAELTLAVSDTGTFTYTLTNTGLGGLFNVALNETTSNPGTAWDFQNFGTITSPRAVAVTGGGAIATIPYLAPGESMIIPVNGQVTNCIDIKNQFTTSHLAEAAISLFSPVTLNLQQPLLDYTGPAVTLQYGTPVAVSMTINNTGLGAAYGVDIGGGVRGIRIATNLPAMGVTVGGLPTGWSYSSLTGTFTYTASGGIIPDLGSITLSFTLVATDECNPPGGGTVLYTAQYEDGCGNPYGVPVSLGSISPASDRPTVTLTKTASDSRLAVGFAGTFDLTLSATNLSKISTTNVIVTDNLPPGLTGVTLTPSIGTATRVGDVVTWTVSKASLTVARTLQIGFTAPSDPCGGGTSIVNTAATNTLTTTAGCTLSASASAGILLSNNPGATVTQNFDVTPAAGDGIFETGSASANLVRDNGEGEFIPFEASYTIGAGYPGNWSGSTFADNFGGIAQLTLVPGSLTVSINGGPFAAVPGGSVTGGTGSLGIDLSFLAGASYFNTPGVSDPVVDRTVVLRYQATAPNAALSGLTRSVTQLVTLDVAAGSGGGACAGGTFTQGAFYTIGRAAAQIGVSVPSNFAICDVFPVTLTVSNANVERASNIRATLGTLVASGDYTYLTGQTPTYGGVFNSGNITLAENGGNNPTFTFTGGDLTGTGTITVNVRRKGLSTAVTALGATIDYDDNENNPTTGTREFTASGSGSPVFVRKADLSLLATPQSVFIYSTTATWTVYVTNGGSGTATATEFINQFPAGVTPNPAAIVAANAHLGLTLGDITIAPADTVTVDLANIPAGETRRVVMVGDIDGDDCNFVSSANSIVARWGCEAGFVQTKQANNPVFAQPVPQIQVVHDTVNTLANLCDTGTVEIIIRNAGSSVVQGVDVTEVLNPLTSGLNFVPGSVRFSLNNGAFNAASAAYNPASGVGTTGSPYVWDQSVIPALATLVPTTLPGTHTVRIRFDITANETSNGSAPQISAGATYDSPCGAAYSSPGVPYTVPLNRPNITVVKQGLNRTVAGGAFASGTFVKTIYAGVGDVVEWRIQITNSGNFPARNVRIKDDLPGTGGTVALKNSAGTDIAAPYTSGNWVTLPDIPASTTVTYYFVETVGTACLDANNSATVTWGCTNNGATAASNLTGPTTNTDTARLNTVPGFGGALGGSVTHVINTTAGVADNGRARYIITLNNGGGTAQGVTATFTLPATMDLDTGWTPLATAIPTGGGKFTTTGTYTGFTITGAHPAYTVTLDDTVTGRLRNGQNAVITLFLVPRTGLDTTANLASPTIAQVAAFAMPETVGNSLDPAASATQPVALSVGFQSTCASPATFAPGNTNINPNSPDLDLTVTPTPVQMLADQAPYTYVFDFTITNAGEANSRANRIQFRLPTVGPGWASISATLVTPGTTGSTVTTTNAGTNYLIDFANLGYLGQNQSALVRVTATTVAASGGPPATSPTAADLVLVGEVEGSVFDQTVTDTTTNYSLDRAAPLVTDNFNLSGYVYLDANHDGNRDTGEAGPGAGIGTLFAKVIDLAAPTVALATVSVNTTTGFYEFTSAVPPGTYRIIIDNNNNLADVTPATPANYLGTEMPGFIREIAVGVTSVVNQNFGVYNGSKLSGSVFVDTGTGGGTANDGIRQGTENGLANVTVKATNAAGSTTYDTTTTAGDGTYTLWIPAAAGATQIRVVETNPAAYISSAASVGTTAGVYTRANDTIAFTNTVGTTYTGLDFGDVPANIFTTDGKQSAVPGATVTYPHTFTAGTSGKVVFTTTALATPNLAGWTHVVYRDLDCSGEAEPSEITPLTNSTEVTVTAGQVICLVVKQFTPAGAPLGAGNVVTINATFTATLGVADVFTAPVLTRTDTTTIGTPTTAGLDLIKEQVLDANCDAAEVTGFTLTPITSGAVPGACVKYRLTYVNNGAGPLSNIVIFDATPAYTTFLSASADTPPADLGATVTILAPGLGAAGAVRWTFTGTLAPGQRGYVYYTVRVQN